MNAVDSVDWHGELVRGLAANSVPGAVLLVSDGQHTVTVAAGVTNVNTGVPMTTDTLCQIGSVTKVWTATLVQILCDEGLLSLDDLVSQYIPEVAEAARTFAGFEQITLRQLLDHTSGMQGDSFPDTGRGDDALQRLVEVAFKEPLVFPPGQWMSYSNTAFMVIGRVLEVVSGETFDELLQAKIVRPLGLTRVETIAERVLLHSASVGHTHAPGEPPRATSRWQHYRSVGPAGLISTTAEDLHAFVMMHLRDGQDPHGKQILSTERAREMRVPQALLPQHIAQVPGEAFGVGWRISPLLDTVRVGHDGGTIGQSACLDTFPDRRGVFILFSNTNGGGSFQLARDLRTLAYPLIAGTEIEPPLTPSSNQLVIEENRPPVGLYERDGAIHELKANDGVWSLVSREYDDESLLSESSFELREGPGGSLWWELPGCRDMFPVLPGTLPDGSHGFQFLGRYYPYQAR